MEGGWRIAEQEVEGRKDTKEWSWRRGVRVQEEGRVALVREGSKEGEEGSEQLSEA